MQRTAFVVGGFIPPGHRSEIALVSFQFQCRRFELVNEVFSRHEYTPRMILKDGGMFVINLAIMDAAELVCLRILR